MFNPMSKKTLKYLHSEMVLTGVRSSPGGGFARKACVIQKIRVVKQKPGLNPPPLLMDSQILANVLLSNDGN